MAKWCNNCNNYQEAWINHPQWKPEESYNREIRCFSCNNWTLNNENTQLYSVGTSLETRRTEKGTCIREQVIDNKGRTSTRDAYNTDLTRSFGAYVQENS